RDLTAAWQHFTDDPERGFSKLVITQHVILIITQGELGFGGARLELLRVLQRFFSPSAPSGSDVTTGDEVKSRMPTRKSRPSECKIGVKLHRTLKKADGFS